LGKSVTSPKTLELARGVVQEYFKAVRPIAEDGGIQPTVLSRTDTIMQDFLKYVQQKANSATLAETCSVAVSCLDELELAIMKLPAGVAHHVSDARCRQVLDTLRSLCPAAASSYEQGLLDLRAGERTSWRGTAVEFREALREVLDMMAPDADVRAQPGFKLEPDTTGPTMKQKVVHVLRSRGASAKLEESGAHTANIVDELVGGFVRSVYGQSARATHSPAGKTEAQRIREYVTLALSELLEVHFE